MKPLKIFRKYILLPLLFVVFLFLSFPPFYISPLIFFAFSFLIYFTQNNIHKKWGAFVLWLLISLPFWVFRIKWIGNMEVESWSLKYLIIGLILLSLYLSSYYGIFGVFIKIFPWWLLPFVWVLLEYVRASTALGFPWSPLWLSLIKDLPAIQIASITGSWGLSFLIMFSNVLFYKYLQTKKTKFMISFLSLLFAWHLFGFVIMPKEKYKDYPKIKVAIHQLNVVPRMFNYWKEYKESIDAFEYFIRYMKNKGIKVDLVIMSESALPGYYRFNRRIRNIANKLTKELKAYLLFGNADSRKGVPYNTAFLISPQGFIVDYYDKIHLVPFGEWLPYEDKIKFLQKLDFGEGDFGCGKRYTIFKVPYDAKKAKFGVLICFESIFPYLSRNFVKRGAEFLVNITNDGWFGKSLGPKEHFLLGIFRAVETRRFVLRSAKTGISAVISPSGKVLHEIPLYRKGTIIFEVPLIEEKTIYVKYGEWFIWFAFFTLLFFLIYDKFQRSKRKRP